MLHDINTNGQQDAGEPGIPNVSVTLKQCVTNTTIGTKLTSATGFYLFTGLTPGCYYVTFVTPAGFTPTLANVGSDITDSDAVAGVTGNYDLASGETDLTVDAGYFQTAPPCPPTQFTLTGSTSTTGTKGNIRTFSAGGVSVKASAFSRKDATGSWATGYLGAFSGGLGVTDASENGSNDTHKVDNIGGYDNYVLFEFSETVTVSQALLDAVGGDSDITVWIGTKNDPFNNHQTLNDAFLASLTKEDNDTTVTGTRTASFNAEKLSGNVLVIASSTSDTSPDDAFRSSRSPSSDRHREGRGQGGRRHPDGLFVVRAPAEKLGKSWRGQLSPKAATSSRTDPANIRKSFRQRKLPLATGAGRGGRLLATDNSLRPRISRQGKLALSHLRTLRSLCKPQPQVLTFLITRPCSCTRPRDSGRRFVRAGASAVRNAGQIHFETWAT